MYLYNIRFCTSSVQDGRAGRGGDLWGADNMSPKAAAANKKTAISVESPEELLMDAESAATTVGVGGQAYQGGAVVSAGSAKVESTESQRAMALIALFGALDPVGKAGLAGIMGFKTKVY